LIPGPIVDATTALLMYWPFAAAGFALMDYNLKTVSLKSKNGITPDKFTIKELKK
jgi:hypothetical protein